MGLNDIVRDSNGEWVSLQGYQVHVDLYGEPYTGGFPPARPKPQSFDWGDSSAGNGPSLPAGQFANSGNGPRQPAGQFSDGSYCAYGKAQGGNHGDTLSIVSMPAYMWMLALAFLAYLLTAHIVLSDQHLGELIPIGSRSIARPACGMGAALLVIWLYRIAMTRVLGALVLGIASAPILAIAVEYWHSKSSHPGAQSFRIPLTWADWAGVCRSPSVLLQLHWSSLAAFAAALLFHAVYWHHRRAEARADQRSWSQRIRDGFKNLLAIGAVALGWGLLRKV